jgi:hypothetical protein
MNSFTIFFLLALLSLSVFPLSPVTADSDPSPKPKDLVQAVAQLVPQVSTLLNTYPPKTGKLKIGIFAFGNEEGKVTPEMGTLPVLIQGELENQIRIELSEKNPARFAVLEPNNSLSSLKRILIAPLVSM